MTFDELDVFLRQPDDEEKKFQALGTAGDIKSLEDEVRGAYSINHDVGDWVINSSKLMKEGESFAVHRHKRFIRFDNHRHDYIELIYVYSGEIKQIIGDKVVNIRSGEICILDPNVLHTIEPAMEKDVAINIIMTAGFFDSIFMSYLSENDIMSKFIINAIYNKKDKNSYLIFPCGENENIQFFMKKLLCEFYDMKVSHDTALHAYILLIFTELLREYKKSFSSSKEQNLNNTIMNELKNYLLKNYKEANLKTTSEHFHFNPEYLSRLIKNNTGESFVGFLQQVKLKESCNLLSNTDYTVEEIMDRVGYSNISHFYKLFKKNYNSTPLEFREASRRQ